MKKIYLLCLILFCAEAFSQKQSNCQLSKQKTLNPSLYTAPENKRSDTADILKYTISLNITDFTTKNISGNTIVRWAPKINGLTYLCLDLLKMTIDSITYNNVVLNYNYNDTLLKINFSAPLNTTDTLDVIVYYHGIPVQDATGWGGWYNTGGYAFNLGVGFDANPHCYGRVYHPCIDNFSERARYTFNISTNGGKIAYCNGLLVKDTTDINGLQTRTWILDKEIPSYLASISVAAYTQVNYSFNAMQGPLQGIVAALPADTAKVKTSFAHLPNAVDAFEKWYGPFAWPRVGYCLVPFNSGAMEHATNITIGKPFVDGSLTYEAELMAHELSHHWWGDHTTCETASDMWLNEGHASYSQFLFTNWVYGYQAYINAVKTNHESMLHFVDFNEGLYAVSGVPHNLTYSDHVYLKGADMLHTMRTYLGDSLFHTGLSYVQQQKAFQNLNTVAYGQLLTTATGVDMNQFMTDWILNPGWPHFSIDSVRSINAGGGNYNVSVYVRQRLYRAPNFYTNVPLEITFKNSNWNDSVKKILMSGQLQTFNFILPFDPVYTGINVGSKISDAVSSKYKTLKATGSVNFAPANLNLNVQTTGIDSSWVRVEHNFVKPDPIKNNLNNYRLNDQHYWKIDGIFSPGFRSKAIFYWDGRKLTSGATAYLDTILTATTSDSVILLYRKNTADDWHEVEKYIKTKLGGSTGKNGYFTVDTLRMGEYTTANGHSNVLQGLEEKEKEKISITLFPNPAKNNFTLEIKNFDGSSVKTYFQLYDLGGKKILEDKISSGTGYISVQNLSSGTYIVKVFSGRTLIGTEKLIVNRE